MWGILLWLAVGLGLAEDSPDVICPDDTRHAVVRAAYDVERTWLHLDGPGFDVSRNRLGKLMMCLDDAVDPEDALAIHRARGLIAFVDGDQDAARRAFAAVHALQPEWVPPEKLVPREHPLWRLFEGSVDKDEDPKLIPFRTAPEHGWSVDGTRFPRPASDPRAKEPVGLPADRSFVLQVFDRKGIVSYSGYHFSTADVPVQDILLPVERTIRQKRRRRDARIASSVLGGLFVVGAATSFGFGWQERELLVHQQVPMSEAEAVQARANTYGGVSYALAGAAALSFTLGFSIPW